MFCIYCGTSFASATMISCFKCGKTLYRPTTVDAPAVRQQSEFVLKKQGQGTPGNFEAEFELLESLGVGGMAEVFRARYRQAPNLVVAVKQMHDSLTQDINLLERFKREAQTHMRLEHANIVTVSRYYECPKLRIVMEFVENGTVERFLKRQNVLPPSVVASILMDLVDALEYYSYRLTPSVVHRDIKPSNIMLDRNLMPKLVDFGIALACGGKRLTRGGVIGSLAYMAPEQILGREIDGRSDQFALGVTVFQMLTGAMPLTAREEYELQDKILKMHPPPPTSLNRLLQPAWNNILGTMMAKEPANRYQSLAKLKNELRPLL